MTHEVTLTTLDGRRLWRRFDGRGRCVAAQDMPKQLTPEEVEQVFLSAAGFIAPPPWVTTLLEDLL